MRIFARTAVLVLLCAALAGCSQGTAKAKKTEASSAASSKKAAAGKTVKLPEVPVPTATKPPKIVPPMESACKVVLSGFVKAEMAGTVALGSEAKWHLNVTTGSMAGKGYNARGFIGFKGKPAPGDYTAKNVATAQFTVVDKKTPAKTWTFSGKQLGGSFKMTLTSVSDKAVHGTIDAALPPVARVAPESSVVHMKVTF